MESILLTIIGALITLGTTAFTYLLKENQEIKKENKMIKNVLFSVAYGLKDLDDPNHTKSASQLADEILAVLRS